jgi:hypothetical protein
MVIESVECRVYEGGGGAGHVQAGMKYGANASVKASQLHDATARASQRSRAEWA